MDIFNFDLAQCRDFHFLLWTLLKVGIFIFIMNLAKWAFLFLSVQRRSVQRRRLVRYGPSLDALYVSALQATVEDPDHR